jgi:hypothetical protein
LITDATGLATFSLRIPNDQRLRFRTVFLQGVAASATPRRFGASAPRSTQVE